MSVFNVQVTKGPGELRLQPPVSYINGENFSQLLICRRFDQKKGRRRGQEEGQKRHSALGHRVGSLGASWRSGTVIPTHLVEFDRKRSK